MSEAVSRERTKVLALAGVVLLLVAVLVLVAVPPASGYEISMYQVYPLYFWLAVAGAIVVGQLVVILTATADDDRRLDLAVGVLLSLLPLLVLTLLPYIRGYPIYGRGDVLSHVGFVRDLPQTGVKGSIYPPMHFQVRTLAAATGQDIHTVINLLPVAFSMVFFGGIYLLAVQLFEDPRKARFAAAFSLFPVMGASHVHAVPFTLSLLLVPTAVYLLVAEQRTQAIPIRLLLPLAVITVLFYHPLTAVFVVITSFVYVAIKAVRGRGGPHRAPTTVPALTLVVFGAWYLSYPGIVSRFRRVIHNVLNPGGSESELEATAQTVQRTSPQVIDLVRIAMVQYGVDMLIFGFAMGVVGLAVLAWWRGGTLPNDFVLLAGAMVALFSFAAVLFFVFDFIGGFGRPLGYGRMFATPLAGAFLYRVVRRADRSWIRVAAVGSLVLVLVVVVSLTTVSMFPSPIIIQSNEQVTAMDLDGTEWTFEHRNEELLIDEFGIDQYRFEHYHTGLVDGSPTVRKTDTLPPDHFNYTTYETYGRSYDEDRYFILTEKGRETYPNRFPDYRPLWRFYPREFERLETDRTVARVYDNGEFTTYRIEATGPPDRSARRPFAS